MSNGIGAAMKTRERILRASLTLFNEHGEGAVSLAQVAVAGAWGACSGSSL